jgi:group I intron endonuclease
MTSGIYLITCLANKDRYVGSSKNISNRRRDHWTGLRLGRHHNTHMQSVWNKYGSDTFVFELLEEVPDVALLIEREQCWINLLRPELNKAKTAQSGFSELRHTDETRNRLAEIQRQRMQSNERRQRLSALAREQNRVQGNGAKGKPVSAEKRSKLRESTLRQFETPESRIRHSEATKAGMTEETRERIRLLKVGLKATEETRKRMANSGRNAWSSYTPEERAARIATASQGRGKRYDGFVSPDGIIYRDIHNLAAFCREHNLQPPKMVRIDKGQAKQHKGWTRIDFS